jgi:hypothetical protein
MRVTGVRSKEARTRLLRGLDPLDSILVCLNTPLRTRVGAAGATPSADHTAQTHPHVTEGDSRAGWIAIASFTVHTDFGIDRRDNDVMNDAIVEHLEQGARHCFKKNPYWSITTKTHFSSRFLSFCLSLDWEKINKYLFEYLQWNIYLWCINIYLIKINKKWWLNYIMILVLNKYLFTFNKYFITSIQTNIY